MPRQIDVAKVLRAAGETKAINLDVSIGQIASSSLIDAVSASYEPWDLICADWVTLIRKGPRFDSVLEINALAGALRASLGALEQVAAAQGAIKRG